MRHEICWQKVSSQKWWRKYLYKWSSVTYFAWGPAGPFALPHCGFVRLRPLWWHSQLSHHVWSASSPLPLSLTVFFDNLQDSPKSSLSFSLLSLFLHYTQIFGRLAWAIRSLAECLVNLLRQLVPVLPTPVWFLPIEPQNLMHSGFHLFSSTPFKHLGLLPLPGRRLCRYSWIGSNRRCFEIRLIIFILKSNSSSSSCLATQELH